MQRYETIAILLPDIPEDEIDSLIERIRKIVAERQGFVVNVDKWGKRRLAYEVKKQREGFYFLIDYVGNGSIVHEIERNYKIDERVLKFMTVKKEGATTAEGIQQEATLAESRRAQAGREGQAEKSENKPVQPSDKVSKEGKSSNRKPVRQDNNPSKEG